MVGCVGRRQVVEELVVGCLVNPTLLTGVPVVVVGVGSHHGAVVEVGGEHPRLLQDQLHHGLCLRLATSEESLSGQVLLAPRGKVAVQVLRALVVAACFVITT